MVVDYSTLPDELPAEPEGFTRRLQMQMKMMGGSRASYSVYGPNELLMPFRFVYRTNKKHPEEGYRGFIVDDEPDTVLTWAELRAIWPDWIKDKKATHG